MRVGLGLAVVVETLLVVAVDLALVTDLVVVDLVGEEGFLEEGDLVVVVDLVDRFPTLACLRMTKGSYWRMRLAGMKSLPRTTMIGPG